MKILFNILLMSLLTISGGTMVAANIQSASSIEFEEHKTHSTALKSISGLDTVSLEVPEPPAPEESEETERDEDEKSKGEPDGLHPEVKEKTEELVEKAEEEDISIRITSGFRSHEEQDALFAQGRTVPGQIVTNARGGESYHNYGLAVDFAIEDGDDLVWDVEYDGNDSGTSDWEEVGEIAKDLGFEWGGDWDDFVDYPHLQMDFDTSLEELKKGDDDLFD